MNLLCAAIGGIITLVGTWFGPVSLFVPIKQVCQIISGMIIFSYVLKTEPKPSKDVSHQFILSLKVKVSVHYKCISHLE